MRRRAIGAEVTASGVDFRVWAPDRESVRVVIGERDVELEKEKGGYFRGTVANARAGTRYRFRLDDGRDLFPDPASRYQPDGPHADSAVIDPSTFAWHDYDWSGPDLNALVLYELHAGTFTREGTWTAAAAHLEQLRDTGINAIELMPVNEFAGNFGWGYDGVDLWAPTRLYGTPDDLRTFIDTAHALGLSVILDVVYNHLGPDGCYLRKFTDRYFATRYKNEWGEALNFDGEGCEGVREFFIENAAYWIDEFHFDGLRLDATQSLFDSSPEHIIQSVVRAARNAAGKRRVFLVGENEPQDVALIERYGLDALWNDDWHHSAMVAATGRHEAYYTDYRGTPQEFVSMAKLGFLYQGQYYSWQKKPRGTSSASIPPERLICYLQNHDQIANSARGDRIDKLTSPGRLRALTALLLLGPHTPMLFQGQEFAASAPFLYFADHDGELADSVAEGRRDFLHQFPSIAAMTEPLQRPNDIATFEASKLDHRERDTHREMLDLHRELLALRRNGEGLRGRPEGAVLGPDAFVLRANDRLLIVNLGPRLVLDVAAEPLLAGRWKVAWTSAPGFEEWTIPAECAVLLEAE